MPIQPRRQFCRNGHDAKIVGLHTRKDGYQVCRGCMAESDRRKYLKRQAAKNGK